MTPYRPETFAQTLSPVVAEARRRAIDEQPTLAAATVWLNANGFPTTYNALQSHAWRGGLGTHARRLRRAEAALEALLTLGPGDLGEKGPAILAAYFSEAGVDGDD